ncbi:MAG: histidine kinase [Loktanella sp.]|nr:histidine kinase [Loktanella sp.]
MGRILIVAMLALAVVVGGAMYYLQVYAYYEDVVAEPGDITLPVTPAGGDPLEVPFSNFRGIDSNSSPLRYRACFDTDISMITLAAAAQALPFAEPRVAPRWFDCFDAAQIGADLQSGAASAYLSIPNIQYGIDRVIAFYPDGRGYIWHEINPCGEAVFNRNPAPENCPEPPESLQ